MADPVEDSLFREIEEDLRQERWTKLWKRYGTYAGGAVLALVLSLWAEEIDLRIGDHQCSAFAVEHHIGGWQGRVFWICVGIRHGGVRRFSRRSQARDSGGYSACSGCAVLQKTTSVRNFVPLFVVVMIVVMCC